MLILTQYQLSYGYVGNHNLEDVGCLLDWLHASVARGAADQRVSVVPSKSHLFCSLGL